MLNPHPTLSLAKGEATAIHSDCLVIRHSDFVIANISIGRSDKDRLGGRLATSALGRFDRFVLHRVIAFAAW